VPRMVKEHSVLRECIGDAPNPESEQTRGISGENYALEKTRFVARMNGKLKPNSSENTNERGVRGTVYWNY